MSLQKHSVAVQIIGGGLAGTEAAWMLARHGIAVDLYEMRPQKQTHAHKTGDLAELVCSNSLRSDSPEKAVGILKSELRQLGSLTLEAAAQSQVPAGEALAVDRTIFSQWITDKISQHPLITVKREEISDIHGLLENGPVIMATGPLTSDALAEKLTSLIGQEALYFYDAISPIVDGASLNHDKLFRASRYGKGEGDDYLNSPLTEDEYFQFVRHVRKGQKVVLKPFEKEVYFESCLPIEVMAERGDLTLAYGPMKPVGLIDPRTGKQPFAVVQLRQENKAGLAFNLVGFQTKLTYPEQARIFRMLAGFESAEFFRMGSIHRNTYINSPSLLNSALQLKTEPRLRFAGQMTGVEGYVESAALGAYAGLLQANDILGHTLESPPPTTALGALLRHVTQGSAEHFQPMNINFGIFEGLPRDRRLKKSFRNQAYAARAKEAFQAWLQRYEILPVDPSGARDHVDSSVVA